MANFYCAIISYTSAPQKAALSGFLHLYVRSTPINPLPVLSLYSPLKYTSE
jgi:hypothetical protein